MNEENNYVEVTMTKSSTSGKIGFSIKTRASDATEEELYKIAESAIKVNLKSAKLINEYTE